MDPRIKTFLKTLAGGLLTAAATTFADPSNWASFGTISLILISVGAFIASQLESLKNRL